MNSRKNASVGNNPNGPSELDFCAPDVAKMFQEFTHDDANKLVDDLFNQAADDRVRFDNLPVEQQEKIRQLSAAQSEIEATGGKSDRDLLKSEDAIKQQQNAGVLDRLPDVGDQLPPKFDPNNIDQTQEVNGQALTNGTAKADDENISSITAQTSDGESSVLTADKGLAQDIKNESAGYKGGGHPSSWLEKSTSTFEFFQTSANPASWMKNIVRDGAMSYIAAGTIPTEFILGIPSTAIGMVRNTPEFWNPILRMMNGDVAAAEKWILDLYGALKSPLGGISRYEYFRGFDEAAKAAGANKVVRFGSRIRDGVEFIPNTMERTQRIANGTSTFMSYLRAGYSPEYAATRALFTARNATTDFASSMGRLDALRRFSPYITSAINGTRSFWRMFSIDPVGVSVRIGTSLIAPIAYLTIQNVTDPKKRAIYESIPEYQKESNIIAIDSNGNVMYLPLNDELKAFSTITRRFFESMNGVNPELMGDIIKEGALGLSPFDIGWIKDLGDTDKYGQPVPLQQQIIRGIEHTGSSFLPPIVKSVYEGLSGRDMYYGTELRPTSGSKVYNMLASTFFGVDENSSEQEKSDANAKVKQILRDQFGSTIGQEIINGVDALLGTPEKERGGKPFMDNIVKTFGDSDMDYDAAQSDFYGLLDSLTKQKNTLRKRLNDIDKKISQASDDEKIELREQKQEMIDKYSQNLKKGLDKWSKTFSLTGGINESRKKQIINLLNLGTEGTNPYADATGRSQTDTVYGDEGDDASRQEYYDALQRYQDLGITDPTAPMQAYKDAQGNWQTTDKTIAVQNAINRQYGAPKEMTYAITKAIKNKVDGQSLYDIKNDYYKQTQAIYDAADAAGRKLTKKDYQNIAAIQEEYLKKFDERMQPIIEQYGAATMTSNADAINAMEKALSGMIPRDEYMVDKKGKQVYRSMPLTGPNVKRWLQQRYGLGYGNTKGLPSDDEVRQIISRINDQISSGRISTARALAERLNKKIAAGSVYANRSDVDQLSNILGY